MSDIKDRFVKIVKTTTGKVLNPKHITVSKVRVNDNPDINRNTVCFLTSTVNGEFKGGMQFYYNRLDLSKVFQDQTPNIQLEYGTRVTTRDIATALATRYGLDLLPEDIQPSGEFYISAFPYEVTLLATLDSLCVTGTVTVRIVDAGEALSTAMANANLDGLNPPNGSVDNKIQGAVYSWNWVAQPQVAALLTDIELNAVVPDTLIPYLNQLSGQTWVSTDTPAPFNLKGATLSYRGKREDHPSYAAGGKHGQLYTVDLSGLATNIGGELLLTLE